MLSDRKRHSYLCACLSHFFFLVSHFISERSTLNNIMWSYGRIPSQFYIWYGRIWGRRRKLSTSPYKWNSLEKQREKILSLTWKAVLSVLRMNIEHNYYNRYRVFYKWWHTSDTKRLAIIFLLRKTIFAWIRMSFAIHVDSAVIESIEPKSVESSTNVGLK